jgi:hypothetical protein
MRDVSTKNAATRVRERSLAALPMLRVGRSVESLTFKSHPAPAREPETNEKCGRDTKMGTKVLAPKSAMNSNTTKPTPTAAAQKRAK